MAENLIDNSQKKYVEKKELVNFFRVSQVKILFIRS